MNATPTTKNIYIVIPVEDGNEQKNAYFNIDKNALCIQATSFKEASERLVAKLNQCIYDLNEPARKYPELGERTLEINRTTIFQGNNGAGYLASLNVAVKRPPADVGEGLAGFFNDGPFYHSFLIRQLEVI